MRILVRIASYRDRELLPTLHDCIEKARWPGDLRFAVCWQHGEDETLDVFVDDPRFRIMDVPFMQSQGMCWARAMCGERYEGEEFTLSLDSHHRFVRNWDSELIRMMELAPSPKPILTSYPPAYTPGEASPRGTEPLLMKFESFTELGTISAAPYPFENFRDLTEPVPSRFLAGGFSFAEGRFLEEVPPIRACTFVARRPVLPCVLSRPATICFILTESYAGTTMNAKDRSTGMTTNPRVARRSLGPR